jgi:hypothetical protein
MAHINDHADVRAIRPGHLEAEIGGGGDECPVAHTLCYESTFGLAVTRQLLKFLETTNRH